MKVNVSVIVVHKNKVLLMQRSLTDSYFPGAWGIPGGYMEKEDETLEDTAVREVFEEMGITVIPTGLVSNNKNEETDSIYIVMSAKLKDATDYPSTINLSEEANDHKWAGREDIDNLEFTPYTKDRISKVLDDFSIGAN
jgi:8-oxo-dGTP pyrophosphatase MutT (NUDIX family)